MYHRIVRVVAWVGELFSRPEQVPPTVVCTIPPSGTEGRTTLPRPLDELIDGDSTRPVRPYLVACERRAREQAARLFECGNGFSVYAS